MTDLLHNSVKQIIFYFLSIVIVLICDFTGHFSALKVPKLIPNNENYPFIINFTY